MAKLVAEEKARAADVTVHRTALAKLEAQQDELRVIPLPSGPSRVLRSW